MAIIEGWSLIGGRGCNMMAVSFQSTTVLSQKTLTIVYIVEYIYVTKLKYENNIETETNNYY